MRRQGDLGALRHWSWNLAFVDCYLLWPRLNHRRKLIQSTTDGASARLIRFSGRMNESSHSLPELVPATEIPPNVVLGEGTLLTGRPFRRFRSAQPRALT